MRTIRPLALATVLLVVACSGRSSSSSAATPARNSMNIVELQDGQAQGLMNLFDLIQRKHPEWLRPAYRAGAAATTATVWMDAQRLGGLGTLRNIAIGGITRVRYLTPNEARVELGPGNPGGAILVSSQ